MLETLSPEIRKWVAFGTGVGIEITTTDLYVSVVRVRPSGARSLGRIVIANFRDRQANEWGGELSGFLKKLGCAHLAATVLLPRREVIVRTLNMPGVKDSDLNAAIGFQMDSLHPYPEDEGVPSFDRLSGSANVLVGIARREVLERYRTLFAESGVKVGSFTFSAAAIYSSLRLLTNPPKEFYCVGEAGSALEVYGESAARPVFSAVFDQPAERAMTLAASELRLTPNTQPVSIESAVPSLSHAAAMSAACPRLSLNANLLPEDQRGANSRAVFIPTVILTLALILLGTALTMDSTYENRRLIAALEEKTKKLQPVAAKVSVFEKSTQRAKDRTKLLDEFRSRSKADLDAILEMTRLLPPPMWLSYLELTRTAVTVGGEADQAAGLLRVIDNSPYFQNSEFTMPIARMQSAEVFRIRSQREELRAVVPVAIPAAAPVAAAKPGEAK